MPTCEDINFGVKSCTTSHLVAAEDRESDRGDKMGKKEKETAGPVSRCDRVWPFAGAEGTFKRWQPQTGPALRANTLSHTGSEGLSGSHCTVSSIRGKVGMGNYTLHLSKAAGQITIRLINYPLSFKRKQNENFRVMSLTLVDHMTISALNEQWLDNILCVMFTCAAFISFNKT